MFVCVCFSKVVPELVGVEIWQGVVEPEVSRARKVSNELQNGPWRPEMEGGVIILKGWTALGLVRLLC